MITINLFPTDSHPNTRGVRTYPGLSRCPLCPHGCRPLQEAGLGAATTILRQRPLNCLVPSSLGSGALPSLAVGGEAGRALQPSARHSASALQPAGPGAGPVSATSSSELTNIAASSPCPLPGSGKVKQWQGTARSSPASLQSPTHLGGGGDGDPDRSCCDFSQLSLSELIIHIAQGKPASRMLTRLAFLISSPHCKSFI